MSADTGVGPAMASGSQVCSGNWPDFDVTPPNRQQRADQQQRGGWRRRRQRVLVDVRAMLKLVAPAAKNRMITPMSRPMSPTRLVRKALRAASELFFSSHQWPMSTNEQRPTSSQPTSICSVFEPSDEEEHRGGEQRQEGEVVGEAHVAVQVLGGVDVHQQRDERDGEEHHRRQAVDAGCRPRS